MIEREELNKRLDHNIRIYFFVKGYIREAWKLARAKKTGQDKKYKKKEPFVNFSEEAQELIEILSVRLLSSKGFKVNDSIPFEEHWIQKDIKVFLQKNREIEKVLNDKILLDALEKSKKRSVKLVERFSHPLMLAGEVCHAASYKFPVPPVNLILESLYGILTYASNQIHKRAMRYDPDLKNISTVEKYSTYTSSFGSIVVIGLIIAALASGPVSLAIAAFLTAIGSLAISASNLMKLGGSIVSLINEIRDHKEPKDTYKWRVFKRVLLCGRYALSSAFYLCMSILAVAAVVALFTNPIGLAVLAGSMFTFALVAVGVSIGTLILTKLADRKIKEITKKHLNQEDKKDFRVSPGYKNKDKHVLGETLDLANEESRRHSKKPIENQGIELMRKMSNHKKHIGASGKPLSLQEYERLSLVSIEELKQKKKHDPIYQGVKCNVTKQKDQDRDVLVIHVPKESSSVMIANDKIERYQNSKQEVEVTLTAHPSDRAIFILLDTNKVFAPLEMEHCGDPIVVLKIFEAAKLTNVEVILDPRDRASLIDNKDPKLRTYFAAIEGWSSEEFQSYSKIKSQGKLGEIPDQLPHESSSQESSGRSHSHPDA